MSKPDIWMPLYIGDYLIDTTHLSTEEHGAYMLLLMQCWTNGGHLPNDDERLRRICRMDKGPWKHSKSVLREFFHLDTESNSLRHGRVDAEIEKAGANIEQRRAAGRASAARRNAQRHGNEHGNDIPNEHVNENPTDYATEPQRKPNTSPSPSPVKPTREKKCSGVATDISNASERENSAATTAPVADVVEHSVGNDLQKGRLAPSRIGTVCQTFRQLGINAGPGVFEAPGWSEVLTEFDDAYIRMTVEQRRTQQPGKPFSAAYFLPVLQEALAHRRNPDQAVRAGNVSAISTGGGSFGGNKQLALEARNKAAAEEWLRQEGEKS